MEITLTQPRGFCAGVVRAIEIVERALEVHGAPVYVVHEIVHNRSVVDELRDKGAVFVHKVDEVPLGAITVLSAHGVPRQIFRKADDRKLRVIDATCPLVTKVQRQVQRYHRQGKHLIIIGHPGHPEVEGHRGQIDVPVHVISAVEEVAALDIPDPDEVAYVTQTTLSLDDTRDVIRALEERFPSIKGPQLEDICYATQNRQNAIRAVGKDVDILLVVCARNSSNSNRLREVGLQMGLESHLIEDATEMDPEWFRPGARVAVTAGASTPESLVREVVERLRELGTETVREVEYDPENTFFPLPDVRQFESVAGR